MSKNRKLANMTYIRWSIIQSLKDSVFIMITKYCQEKSKG